MTAPQPAAESLVDRILDALTGTRIGSGAKVLCPAHDDRNPSLHVTPNGEGILVKCHAGCPQERVVGELRRRGLWPEPRPKLEVVPQKRDRRPVGEPVATYDYPNADGTSNMRALRFRTSDGGKTFIQERWDAEKRAFFAGCPRERTTLYRAPKLAALPKGSTVFWPEGEKDVHSLEALGLIATTNPGGSELWCDHWAALVEDQHVVLLSDNDDAGKKAITKRVDGLLAGARSLRVLRFSELPIGGDVTDWLAAGGTKEELLRRVARTRPRPKPSPFAGEFTAAELMSYEMPALSWVVSGIIPEGLTILGGKSKMGKSLLTLSLCISVATGSPALGTVPTTAGRVLYGALEDGARRLHSRLRKQLAGSAPPPLLHFRLNWRPLDQGGLEDLSEWLEQYDDARLVVLDTFQRIRPEQTGRNAYADDYHALIPLQSLAEQYNVAIVLVHHLTKGDVADPLEALNGTSGIPAAVDGILVLRRQRAQSGAILEVVQRDGEGDSSLGLMFDQETTAWTITGSGKEFVESREQDEITTVLREAGEPMSAQEIADALEATTALVRPRLFRMWRSSIIERVGRGKYRLTTKTPGPPANQPWKDDTWTEEF